MEKARETADTDGRKAKLSPKTEFPAESVIKLSTQNFIPFPVHPCSLRIGVERGTESRAGSCKALLSTSFPMLTTPLSSKQQTQAACVCVCV